MQGMFPHCDLGATLDNANNWTMDLATDNPKKAIVFSFLNVRRRKALQKCVYFDDFLE